MNIILAEGRPARGSREPVEEACYDFLEAQGVSFIRADHDAAGSMEALAPVEAALGCRIAKNLFLTNRQQTDFYLLLMPALKPFKTKYLSAQLGCSRLSFGSEEQLLACLGTARGSASVLGLLNDREKRVRLVADAALRQSERFACHPCRNTGTLCFSMRDLTEKLLPALGREITWVELPEEVE